MSVIENEIIYISDDEESDLDMAEEMNNSAIHVSSDDDDSDNEMDADLDNGVGEYFLILFSCFHSAFFSNLFSCSFFFFFCVLCY